LGDELQRCYNALRPAALNPKHGMAGDSGRHGFKLEPDLDSDRLAA
jgi:hypothetical protein